VETFLVIIAGLSLIIWIGLAFFWHGFWRTDQKLPSHVSELETWPDVVAVVPARNEEETIGHCLRGLLDQDYPGAFSIVLSNDSSTDNTSLVAREISSDRVKIVEAGPLEPGWAGKMWALNQGVSEARAHLPEFFWFTDADIYHRPGVLRALVYQAESKELSLTSLMVKLRVTNMWEKLLVPAFIFFFCLLYPFRAVNDPTSKIAGAAGGCAMIRASALEKIGGLGAVRDAVIDDCAIGRAVKTSGGAIWLGLGEASWSLRGYETLRNFWDMVKRSAYTQLNHSPILALGVLAGLALTFVAPVVLALFGPGANLAFAAWLIMCGLYWPTSRYYRLNLVWVLSLPLAAVLFGAMTLDSALSHHAGKPGTWRDRDISST
jgi:hopene-associated glycosyltransferase HpnB